MKTHLTHLLVVLSLAVVPLSAGAVELSPEPVDAELVSDQPASRADWSGDWEKYLRAQRGARLADLRAYAAAGVFPRKRGEPGWHHQFLDADGNPCAVASLIMTSGRADLVHQMAATNNGVVVSELDDGPIVDWVLASGLTMEEIAVIQEPGFERGSAELIGPIDGPPVQLTPELAEQQRLQHHLAATLSLLEADQESSIWKAMTRLGDLRFQPPPSARVAHSEPVRQP